jgi:succinate dehydrogenase/fumarate reductase flavoprotein subunit
MSQQITWMEEADVVVVGYGGAGAAAAVTAHDAGVKVLLVEKQHNDTPNQTRHTPSTRMSGGAWFSPADAEKGIAYLEAMNKMCNEPLDAERKEIIRVFVQNTISNTDWMKKIGVEVGGADNLPFEFRELVKADSPEKIIDPRIFAADFPELPGADAVGFYIPREGNKYRNGAALFRYLSNAVRARNIPVIWEAPARHLITQDGEVRGVMVSHGGKEVGIRAKRGVVLTCGGFEFNEWMKQNYIRAYPAYFYCNPGNTGDGISMAMEIGANLWHMNNTSWRALMKFPDFPIAFCTQNHESFSIFVDKRGYRFSNERYKPHAFGYELINYDCYAQCYPKIPCYWIFSEERRLMAPLASFQGPCNPPGGIMGDAYYIWSKDNQQEIDRGWVMKAGSVEELAHKILVDPDNNGLMNASVLAASIKQYNEYCRKGEDLAFHKAKQWLKPIEGPPYYAVKLWPGGPNTQGGPKRNARSQILRVDNNPIPRLYSAGELGSIWGMVYQGAGNIAECIAFGRIAGANAAAEKVWK